MILLDDRQKDLMKDVINRILGNGYPLSLIHISEPTRPY